jgi:hypothetical protein
VAQGVQGVQCYKVSALVYVYTYYTKLLHRGRDQGFHDVCPSILTTQSYYIEDVLRMRTPAHDKHKDGAHVVETLVVMQRWVAVPNSDN